MERHIRSVTLNLEGLGSPGLVGAPADSADLPDPGGTADRDGTPGSSPTVGIAPEAGPLSGFVIIQIVPGV